MTAAPRHIVQHAAFQVALGRERDALAVQAGLADFFHRTIAPALDQALSAYAPAGDRHIERLVIDLGALDLSSTGRRSPEKIRAMIAEALQGLHGPQTAPLAAGERLQRCLADFLRTGRVPWDAPSASLAELEEEIRALPAKALAALLEVLRPLLDRPTQRRRLLAQFGSSFVQWLLAELQPGLAAAFAAEAGNLAPGLDPTEGLEIQLRTAAGLPPGSPPRRVAEAVRARLTAYRAAAKNRGVAVDEGFAHRAGESAGPDEEGADTVAAGQALFVSLAGVVLLHPFFTRFFDQCGLLTDGSLFKNRDCREKGVHLLHFLAAGRMHPEEPHTILLKVLCGLEIHEPVARFAALGDAERNEAAGLLEAALRHWKRLKRTSPDGLRAAFLQREGKLTRTRQGWHLTVEQQSIDILLGTLPWTLSMIRLPWLAQPVQVDWA
jgi:hypothetical protein